MLGKCSNVSNVASSGVSDNTLLIDRPYGGLAILWHSKYNSTVSIYNLEHNRFCGIKFSRPTFNCAIICIYLPNSNYSSSVVDDNFSDTLHELETFIYSLGVDCIMLAGDFNVDFMRNNAH